EALIERARDRLHRHAAVDVRDQYAAVAVAGDAGDGAVLERDLDQRDGADVARLIAALEGVVDRSRRAFHGAARPDVVSDLRAQPRRIQQRLDRLAEELVIGAGGDDAHA